MQLLRYHWHSLLRESPRPTMEQPEPNTISDSAAPQRTND